MHKGLDDKSLIGAFRNGDERAFSELLQRYEKYAYNIALNCVKNDYDAEDILQDCFIKLITSTQNFRMESKFSTWLYSVVYFTSIDYLRKKKRTFVTELRLEDYKNIEDEESSDWMMKEIKYENLQKAIGLLATEDATIITLFYFMSQSLNDISAIIQVQNINTVKVKLFRARNSLKTVLNKILHENSDDKT